MALNSSLSDYDDGSNYKANISEEFQIPELDNYLNPLSSILPDGIESLIIIIVNIPYCMVTLKSPSLRIIMSNILSVGLSFAYIFAAIGTIVSKVLTLYYDFSARSGIMQTLTQLLSALLITIMTVERYVAVIKPLHYHSWITKSRIIKAAVASCIYSLLFSLIPVFMNTNFERI
jgi:hypothetical protein